MEIVYLSNDNYEEWNKFCLESDDAWFWHTTDWLEYALSFNPEYNSRSLSFMLLDNNQIMGLCPLIKEEIPTEKGGKIYEFSSCVSGGDIVVPALNNNLSADRKEEILRIIFGNIDKLALDNNIKKHTLRFTPLANSYANSYNYLMKFNYLNSSLNTQVIDLSLTEEQLFHDIRKGHRCDIKKGEKAYSIQIFDKVSITEEDFTQYRLLHHKAAKRVTRPKETFERMHQWISNGKGILCGTKYNGGYIGFSLVIVYKQGAFYGSSCYDPDVNTKVPVSHFTQWKIINWLKDHGIKYYKIGLQQFGPQIYDIPNKKCIDISSFKRGFGGKTIPIFRGIKYYDKEYMRQDLSEKMERLISTYGG